MFPPVDYSVVIYTISGNFVHFDGEVTANCEVGSNMRFYLGFNETDQLFAYVSGNILLYFNQEGSMWHK